MQLLRILKSRSEHILPLPNIIKNETKWHIDYSEDNTAAAEKLKPAQPVTKQQKMGTQALRLKRQERRHCRRSGTNNEESDKREAKGVTLPEIINAMLAVLLKQIALLQ